MATAGDFEVYLLAQSWSPLFCCGKPDRCTTVPWAFSANHLSLHGLWPSYSEKRNGSPSPMDCHSKAKLLTTDLPREYIDRAPSFVDYDPKLHKGLVGPLAKHEWKKHGTCSNLNPPDYFQAAVRAMDALPGDRGTPELLTKNVGGEVSQAELRKIYHYQVGIKADKQCRLEEVTTCWAKKPDGNIGHQVNCPAHVMSGGRNNCKCKQYHITKLGQCLAGDGTKGKK